MTPRELDEIQEIWWPRVLRQLKGRGDTTWRRGFAISIARHLKNPEWRPSQKHEELMRLLVAEFRAFPNQSKLGGEN